jgi:hypothetical membrane protein
LGAIITDLFGVIFIIAFIIVLLAIGGVLHLPRVGVGHWGSIIILLILVFIVPYILVTFFSQYFPSYAEIPESFKVYKLPDVAGRVFEMLGLPSDWSYVPAIIYLFILPFAGIYVIVWAFLTLIGIFPQKNVNRVLAFLITFLTIPIGFFVKMVWLLFSVIGAWSVAVFAITFIIGVFLRGVSLARKEYVGFIEIRKARLKEGIERLRALEGADLETIKSEAPRVIYEYPELPLKVKEFVNQATRVSEVSKAQELIRSAVAEAEKFL